MEEKVRAFKKALNDLLNELNTTPRSEVNIHIVQLGQKGAGFVISLKSELEIKSVKLTETTTKTI